MLALVFFVNRNFNNVYREVMCPRTFFFRAVKENGSRYPSPAERCGVRIQIPHEEEKGSSEITFVGLRRTSWVHQGCRQRHRSRSRTRCTFGVCTFQGPVQVPDEEGVVHRARRNVHWPVSVLRKEG